MTAISGDKLAMARRAVVNLVAVLLGSDGEPPERELEWFWTMFREHPLFAALSEAERNALLETSEQDLEKYPSLAIWAGLIPKELRTQTYEIIVRAAFADGAIKAEEAKIADFLEAVFELPKDEGMAIILKAKGEAKGR